MANHEPPNSANLGSSEETGKEFKSGSFNKPIENKEQGEYAEQNTQNLQKPKENRLASEELVRRSIQIKKVNTSEMLTNRSRKNHNAPKERGDEIRASQFKQEQTNRKKHRSSSTHDIPDDPAKETATGKKSEQFQEFQQESSTIAKKEAGSSRFNRYKESSSDDRKKRRSMTEEEGKIRTQSLSLVFYASNQKSKAERDSGEEFGLKFKDKSKSMMPPDLKLKNFSSNPMAESSLLESAGHNYSFVNETLLRKRVSKYNEGELNPEDDRIKNNPLLEREQLRKSIMTAKQKGSGDSSSFFAGSKLSAEIFRHLKESSNQSYLNILKKDEKAQQQAFPDESQKKYHSPANAVFSKGIGASHKKSLSNQHLSSMKKYFMKDFLEKNQQDSFDKTLDPNAIIFNQLAPSALASYRWRSTSTRNRIIKMRSQSPTVRYMDEIEELPPSDPILNIDKVAEKREKQKFFGVSGGQLKPLMNKFVLNSSFTNNDYFDFILQLIDDNNEIFGMKFTDYGNIIDFMKLDQSKGIKEDVLEAHETMNYIKKKKEQYEKQGAADQNLKDLAPVKQISLEFFPVPPKKIPPTCLVLKTNSYRQAVVEVDAGPLKPGSASNREKDPYYNTGTEKKNSGFNTVTNIRMFGSSPTRKKKRSSSRENK